MSLTKCATPAEARVARKLVREVLARGYSVSVKDSIEGDGEWVLRRSTSFRTICDALASTGSDVLRLRHPSRPDWYVTFALIWGNASDGSELIADHSDKPEAYAIYGAVYDQ